MYGEAANARSESARLPFRIGWGWWLFFAVWALCFWGARPLWDPDAARYAEVAREALVDGHWIVPHLNGEPHLTKPPFTYWISALGMKLFGINAWGANFFLSLAFLGTIACVMETARSWSFTRRETLGSGLVFATAFLPMACASVLSTDMFLTFWETLGVLCAWKVWTSAAHVGRWRIGFWLAFGMAFLTKGPPGWLPLVVIAIYTLSRPHRQRGHGLQPWWGVPLMLMLAGSWFILLELWIPGTLRHLWDFEVVGRVASDVHDRSHPVYFYLLTLFIAPAPYLFLWPELLRRAGRRLRSGVRALSDTQHFSLLWFVVPLAIFSLASAKMYLYLVPIVVPLALWMGLLLAEWSERIPSFSRRGRLAVRLIACTWLVGWVLFRLLPVGFSGARTQVTLARAVEELNLGEGHRVYSAGDYTPPPSFMFYTGRLVTSTGLGFAATARFVREEEAAGRPSSVLVRTRFVERLTHKLTDDGWHVLRSDQDFTFIHPRLGPPGGAAAGRPAGGPSTIPPADAGQRDERLAGTRGSAWPNAKGRSPAGPMRN